VRAEFVQRPEFRADPPPDCLNAADDRLQDALTFQGEGLDAARDGVQHRDRVRLLQGVLLTAVSLWRGGQAVIDVRWSSC